MNENIFNGNLIKGDNVSFGKNVNISAKNIIIGSNVIIRDNVHIKCLGDFILGDFSIIDRNISISCNNFKAGKWLYTYEGVEIGRGGCFSKDSNITIGDYVGIFENAIINPNSEIHIGDNTGIGAEVMIWTHGAWLNPLEGFPKDFGPVSIGSNVWLPARCVVLPNISIGDNTVIGINSLVNKNIPSGVLAGIPIKIIKENLYPKKLNQSEKNTIIDGIINDWKIRMEFKNINNFFVNHIDSIINITVDNDVTEFNLEEKTIAGNVNSISEDFRDFLRRNGIKIYNNNFFKSI